MRILISISATIALSLSLLTLHLNQLMVGAECLGLAFVLCGTLHITDEKRIKK